MRIPPPSVTGSRPLSITILFVGRQDVYGLQHPLPKCPGPIDSLGPSNPHAPGIGSATHPRAIATMNVLNTAGAHHRISMPHKTFLAKTLGQCVRNLVFTLDVDDPQDT